MRPIDHSHGPEWAILESLCLSIDDASEQADLEHLLGSDELDWAELLGQALRHQMMPMLAQAVLGAQLDPRPPFYIEDHLQNLLDLNRLRVDFFRTAAAELTAALDDARIRFVATKGITFESTIYGGAGVRRFKDLDFMIEPESRDATIDLLDELGYSPGVFDRQAGVIVDHERRDHMRYQLHPDHLPRHAKVLADPCVRYLYIDFANSLTWHKAPYDIPVSDAFRGAIRQPIPGRTDVELSCFAPEFQFLFTVLHLFREAWLENFLAYGIDVSLMKFGDVVRLFGRDRAVLCSTSFATTLRDHGLIEPVFWVLEHIDRTFGTEMVEEMSLDADVDGDWLNRAHPSVGRPRQWVGSMRERLVSKRREQLFDLVGTEAEATR